MTLPRRTPLRRRRPLGPRIGPKRSGRIGPRRSPRRGPDRDPVYLAWVRTLHCIAPGAPATCRGIIEAHHAGPRGLGQKSADRTAIPICRQHHAAWHDARSPFRGWTKEQRASWAADSIYLTQQRWALVTGGAAG